MTITTETRSAFCPRCFADLAPRMVRCEGCGLAFTRHGGVLDVLGEALRGAPAEAVEAFYDRAPFPGYAPGEDGASLLDRSRRSPFSVALDRALPPSGRFLSVGCGTAQMPAFLALAGPRRRVVAIDGCAASLAEADAFAIRASVRNMQLVRADLFEAPVTPGAFDVVSCRGVVHHTPEPERAIECVASCVAPGGVLLLGFYEALGRLPHRLRRGLARMRGGRPWRTLDPVLRRTDLEESKKRRWIEDQYHHPLECVLSLPRVLAHLASLGFEWVRTVPPLPAGGLFDPAPHPTAAGLLGRRLGWALGGLADPDAGLVCVVARRDERAHGGEH